MTPVVPLAVLALLVVAVVELIDRRWWAQQLVKVSGLIHRTRRHEFAAELHFLQRNGTEDGLGYAAGTLLGAVVERATMSVFPIGPIGPQDRDAKPLLLSVPGGSIVGLIGWSTNGRSSIASVRAQVLASNDAFETVSIDSHPNRGDELPLIGDGLVNSLTVADNLLLGPRRRWIIGPRQQRREARQALALIGVTHIHPEAPVRELSRCDRALVEIASAAGSGKPIVVQDDPSMSGPSRAIVEQALQILRSRGVSVVLVTHSISDICRFADRVAVMREGRIAFEMDTAHLSPQDVVHELVGGPGI